MADRIAAPEGHEQSWRAPDGVRYRIRRWGSGPPLVLLHGFTGGANTWAEVAGGLGSGWGIVAPDLLGHGDTGAPTDPARYAVERQVADLAGILASIAPGPVALLGYSMGARLALAYAVAHPDCVERLVLESGGAGIENADTRASRRAADDALADRIERDGITTFVEEWERLPLWASQSSLPGELRRRQREQRMANRAAGLANSLRGFGQGVQPALWDALPLLPMPVLAVAGGLDTKYAAIAARIGALVPSGTMVVVPDAGHTPHLERPKEFCNAVASFLRGRPMDARTD